MTTAKVLISDKLSDVGLDVLRSAAGIEADYKPGLSEDELAECIGDYDGLVIRSGSKVTAKVLAAAERLRVVGRAGIGVDNIDVPVASRRGVVVMNTPTGNAVTTAEHALSLMMSLARKIPQATASMRAGKWEKSKFQGREIAGKTLGIVGLGNIGRIVADRAKGLKLNVIAHDPVVSEERASELGIGLVSTDELFKRSDFITVHAPLVDGTRGLLGREAFAQMKKGVLIVNAARGGIVDEEALAEAIREKRVAGAALDVFVEEPPAADHPLLSLDEVIVTPHLGASTSEAQERVAREICQQVVDYLTNDSITNAINVPSVGGDEAERLKPYLSLGTMLGKLLGQLEEMQVSEVRVTCAGEAGDLGARPITNAVLAGYLDRFVEEPINAISAPFEARERGITVQEIREESARRYTTTVRVTASGDDGLHTATGTIGASGEPQLVGLNGYELDAVLGGRMLVVHNDDLPGVIGNIGSVLGKAGINVARLQVGLNDGKALALWNVDQEVPEDTQKELAAQDYVRSVQLIRL